jgi:hypothetical protein
VHGVCVLSVSGKLKWTGLGDLRDLSHGVVDIVLGGLAAVAGGGGQPRRRRA